METKNEAPSAPANAETKKEPVLAAHGVPPAPIAAYYRVPLDELGRASILVHRRAPQSKGNVQCQD